MYQVVITLIFGNTLLLSLINKLDIVGLLLLTTVVFSLNT